VPVPAAELADVARLAEDDVDPTHVLRRILDHATTLVPGCTGAGLTVLTGEDHRTAAFTDERVDRCHAVQFEPRGSGPARETLRFGEPRRSDRLARETRWPEFARTAVAQGFGSCLALPLHSDSSGATALNLYADATDVFAGTTFDVALLFAAQGGVALDNAARYRDSQDTIHHLHETLTTRSVIERAKGVLMREHHVSSDDAFGLLRGQSQTTHRRLRDVALSLLESHDPDSRHDDIAWTPPRPPSAPR
jgi:hypothetical protein